MKKGNLLLLLITLLIITIVVVFSAIIISKRNNIDKPPIAIINKEVVFREVTDRNNYYIVKNCVNKFYQYYATMFDTKEDADIIKTYSLFNEKYIDYKRITTENILAVLTRKGETVANICDMYVAKQSETMYVYVVKGILREKLTLEKSEFEIMIQLDTNNGTFSVLPQDYIHSKYKTIKLDDSIKLGLQDSLEENRYNLYYAEEVKDSTYAIDLFEHYKEEALYYPELAYEKIDEEYRNQKFGSLERYKKHVETNKTQIINMSIKQYQKTVNNDYTKYICVDDSGRYYIFTQYGLMKYGLILDTYTVNLPEFLEKYNKATTIDKVGYNIKKCLDAINYRDYQYVYNKLDLEFKALNYPTLESFENKVSSKLFNQNEVKAVNGSREGETYIYKMTITDEADEQKEQNMTVIMKLKEGTDFVMSLSFQ